MGSVATTDPTLPYSLYCFGICSPGGSGALEPWSLCRPPPFSPLHKVEGLADRRLRYARPSMWWHPLNCGLDLPWPLRELFPVCPGLRRSCLLTWIRWTWFPFLVAFRANPPGQKKRKGKKKELWMELLFLSKWVIKSTHYGSKRRRIDLRKMFPTRLVGCGVMIFGLRIFRG